LFSEGGFAESFSLVPYLEQLNQKYGADSYSLDKADAVFDIIGIGYDIRLVTDRVEYNTQDGLALENWFGTLLLKIK